MFIAGCNLSDAEDFGLRFARSRSTVGLDKLKQLIDRGQVVWVGRTEEEAFLQQVEKNLGFRIPKGELDTLKKAKIRGMIIIEAYGLPIRAIREGERYTRQETRIAQASFAKHLRARKPRRTAA